jgi:VCBS repeat-containing protein
VLATDADRGDSLSYAVVGDAPAGLTFASDGTWSFDASGSGLDALAAGETQTLLVNYAATDRAGAVGTSTLTITVTGANDEPVALAASATAVEDGYVSGQLSASDPDHGATLTYSLVGRAVPPGFTLDADGGWAFDTNLYEYQSLAEGETDEFTIGYRVTDEHGASSTSTLTVTLTGANDAPVTTSHWAEAIEGETASGQLIAMDQDHGAELIEGGVGFPGIAFKSLQIRHWVVVKVETARSDQAKQRSRRDVVALNGLEQCISGRVLPDGAMTFARQRIAPPLQAHLARCWVRHTIANGGNIGIEGI